MSEPKYPDNEVQLTGEDGNAFAIISAYRIGDHVYLVNTRDVADPELPRTLPISSPRLTLEEARRLADQILAAAKKPVKA